MKFKTPEINQNKPNQLLQLQDSKSLLIQK